MGGQNRIVVNYGDFEGLILIGCLDNNGKEFDIQNEKFNLNFQIVKKIPSTDYKNLRENIKDDEEGFVIHFYRTGLRMKIKGAEYCRLHRIMTEISSREIWECLSLDKPITSIIDKVPDEFMEWVKKIINDLQTSYWDIEETSIIENTYKTVEAQNLVPDYESNPRELKKVFATLVKDHPYKHIIFRMFHGWDYKQDIWKMIYPKRELPFKNAE